MTQRAIIQALLFIPPFIVSSIPSIRYMQTYIHTNKHVHSVFLFFSLLFVRFYIVYERKEKSRNVKKEKEIEPPPLPYFPTLQAT